MEGKCGLALVCNTNVRLASLCIYSAMLIYLTTFIFLTVFKYKVKGFTLRLLVGLEIAVIALLTGVIVNYFYEDKLTLHYVPNSEDKVAQRQFNNLEWGYLALHFISTTISIGIFWVFALKYWSVALKFELVVNEQEITSKTRLVDAIMLGGLIILVVA